MLAAGGQLSLKAGDRALREIRTALEDRSPLPTKQDRQDIQARLEAVRAVVGPRVQELRDADEWQRWANLQVQEELSREMEALKAEENLEAAGRRMRELQNRWKQVALAPRAQGEAMWRRFKTAQDEVFGRTSAHVAAQNEDRTGNLARKQALCERAEALADSSDWVKTATEIQQLQAEWKTIGQVTRGNEKAIWERFRAACDRFFTRRQEDLKKRRDDWSVEPHAQGSALRAGRGARPLDRLGCDGRRSSSSSRPSGRPSGRSANRSRKPSGSASGPPATASSSATSTATSCSCSKPQRRARRSSVSWRRCVPPSGSDARETCRPISRPRCRALSARWNQGAELPRACSRISRPGTTRRWDSSSPSWPQAFAGTELDPDATKKRMEKLLARVEELMPAQQGKESSAPLSPAELLAKQWRERLASNTMGGRAPDVDDSRWRAAEQEIRNLQSQWTRLGPVPATVAGPLNERFQRAVRKFYDQRKRA